MGQGLGYWFGDDGAVVTEGDEGYPIGTVIQNDGTVIYPTGHVATPDGRYYLPEQVQVQAQDAATGSWSWVPTWQEFSGLLNSGANFARVFVQPQGDPYFRPGYPLQSPMMSPYPARVRLPDGTVTTVPYGTTVPAGATILGPQSSGFGDLLGGNTLILLAVGTVAVLAFSRSQRG